jgi:hypothetical protein
MILGPTLGIVKDEGRATVNALCAMGEEIVHPVFGLVRVHSPPCLSNAPNDVILTGGHYLGIHDHTLPRRIGTLDLLQELNLAVDGLLVQNSRDCS